MPISSQPSNEPPTDPVAGIPSPTLMVIGTSTLPSHSPSTQPIVPAPPTGTVEPTNPVAAAPSAPPPNTPAEVAPSQRPSLQPIRIPTASENGGSSSLTPDTQPSRSPSRTPTVSPVPSTASPTRTDVSPTVQPAFTTAPTKVVPTPTVSPAESSTERPSTPLPDTRAVPSTGPSQMPTSDPTPSPTPAPIPAPTSATPTPALNSAPTPAPTTVPAATWELVAGPLTGSGQNTEHGRSVAISGDYLVVGEPLAVSVGQVRIYRQKPSPMTDLSTVVDVTTQAFGSALDLTTATDGVASLLIGAKDSEEQDSGGGMTRFGSATYYEFDATGQLRRIGSVVRPPGASLFDAGGEFGGAVAMASTVRRFAVAAPESSANATRVKTGKVYTYQYNGSRDDWEPMSSTAGLLIGDIGSKFGTSLDMARDGSRLLVGAPEARGGDGSVYYYGWDDNTKIWTNLFRLPGVGSGEALGTSVAILTDEGGTIAFGGPLYNNKRGVIRVFTDLGGFFVQLGSDITGFADGQQVGLTLCGSQGQLAFGTNTGSFHVYKFDGEDWVEVATGPSTGFAVVSIAMSEDGDTVVVGLQNEQTQVYKLQ